jgi:hypothetical protein
MDNPNVLSLQAVDGEDKVLPIVQLQAEADGEDQQVLHIVQRQAALDGEDKVLPIVQRQAALDGEDHQVLQILPLQAEVPQNHLPN